MSLDSPSKNISDLPNENSQPSLNEFIQQTFQNLNNQNTKESQNTLNQFKAYLQSILPNQQQTDQFFNILNSFIFPSNNNKKISKDPFILFPLFFNFNPKFSVNYIDNFLSIITSTIDTENKTLFSFISQIFGQVVNSLFSLSSSHSNSNGNGIVNYNKLNLNKTEKETLYEKLLSFCLNKIIQQNHILICTCGCLFLTELIENCDIVKEEKHHLHLWNSICEYIDNATFPAKLEVLNCIISLIFAIEQDYKPYANVTLFKILDYLTDKEWMKRKLSLNVVYTLAFYCLDEIFPLKDYIIEFLNVLKNDSVQEVKEVCLQTLKFLEEESVVMSCEGSNSSRKGINAKGKEVIEKGAKSKSVKLLKVNNNNNNNKANIKSNSVNRTPKSKKNKNARSISVVNSSMNLSFQNKKFDYLITNSNKRTKQISVEKKNNICLNTSNEFQLKNSIERKPKIQLLKQYSVNRKKDKEDIDKNLPINTDPNSYIQLKQFQESNKIKLNIKKKKDNKEKDQFSNTIPVNKIDINKSQQNLKSNLHKLLEDKNASQKEMKNKPTTKTSLIKTTSKNLPPIPEKNPISITEISTQLFFISKTQETILSTLTSLSNKVNDNYNVLANRINQLETTVSNMNKSSLYKHQKVIDKDWEKIQSYILNSNYSEALEIGIANDSYLFNVLKELNKENTFINNIKKSTLEDVLSRLIALIPKGEKLDIIITFINHVITKKINIKNLTKQNLKDAITYLYQNHNNFNLENDIQSKLTNINNNIELI